MSIHPTLRRVLAGSSAALAIACGPAHDRPAGAHDALETNGPSVSPSCHEGRDGAITITLCEIGDPALLRDVLARRWLPPRARELLAGSSVTYGRAESEAINRDSSASKRHGSHVSPHFDTHHLIAGWDIYDASRRVSVLALTLDDRWCLVLSGTDAENNHTALVSLQRFLDSPGTIEERARALSLL